MPLNKKTHCPLCGARRKEASLVCSVCNFNAAQKPPVLLPKGRKKLWIIVSLIVAVLLVFTWFLVGDLFKTPEEVANSRTQFRALHRSYLQEKERWNEARDSLEIGSTPFKLETLPLELFIALLAGELDLQPDIAVYPLDLEHHRLMLSKRQKLFFPLSIILSLEIELVEEEGKLTPHFIAFRRGSRRLPQALAWVYFGKELQTLSHLHQRIDGSTQS